MSEYLIIGSCIAAVGAVEGIRSADPSGLITVIDGEGRGAYTRPLISYYLTDPEKNREVNYRSPDILSRYGVKVVSGRAEAIDPGKHEVRLEDGTVLGYDRLLIATGASPIIPAIPGVEFDWVHTFYTIKDAEILDNTLRPGRPTVVIGSGLIGMKAAEALCQRGMPVTIIEREDHLLPALLSAENAEIVENHLTGAGITVLASTEVTAITAGHKVILSSGIELSADQVIMAVGAKPAVKLAVDCGLRVNQGIVVDVNLRTSDANIFAAGDVTETINRQTGKAQIMALLPHAHREGYIAGCNMAGVDTKYAGGILVNSVKLIGMHICVAGSLPAGSSNDLIWEQGSCRLELQIAGNRLYRYTAVNLPEISGPLTYIIENELDIWPEEWKSFISEKPALDRIPGQYWERLRGDETNVVA